ncbi:MAG: AbrB/MazE/SpoVT family DNA-binding domain-containing protein [Nanoarchaeota archaeon]
MVIQTKTKIREWGNSFGIVIPRELVIKEGFRVDDSVTISIERNQTLENFFGKLKSKMDTQKMKDESRRIWKMD